MPTLTKKSKDKARIHAKIKSEYFKLMKEEGSQKSGAYEILSQKHGVSVATVGRIVGNIKR